MTVARSAFADPAAGATGIPGHLHPLSFIARLEWRLQNDPPKRKSDRTRERLKLACAHILEERGIHDLKAGDVSAGAGLAEGSFYLYFTDKRDITRTVLGEFQAMYFSIAGNNGATSATAYESIRRSNLIWFAFARSNAGLFRCLYQFADEDPAFGVTVQQSNMHWHQRVLRSLPRLPDAAATSEPTLLLLIYLLGGMMDDLARKLIVYPDPQLIGVLASVEADDAMLADVTSLVWLRLLRPLDPMPATSGATTAMLAAALFPQLQQGN